MNDRKKLRSAVLTGLALTLFPVGASRLYATEKPPSPQVKQEKSTNSAEWRTRMQKMYKVLAEITEDTTSDQRFNNPKNKTRIDRNVETLYKSAHDMSKKGASPDLDPSVTIISGLFEGETKRAHTALKSGNRYYARSILSSISGYCIACHTRNNTGPQFSSLPFEPSSDLKPIEQGRFLAATRQYDRAMDVFQKMVNDPSTPVLRPIEWELAARYGLSIAVRVKKDPAQARALVERIIGSKNGPYFLKHDATQWRTSIIEWEEELGRQPKTEEGLYSEAMRLITKAHEVQKYPADHSADILYLRATSVIHDLLQMAPNGKRAEDAFLMAGMCYEVLRSLNLDELHDIYYEACIHKAPHTSTAESCYRRYEKNTYEGFTGSAGTFLPPDVKQKLKVLEDLAHPIAPGQPG
jgi:hypothetical protein